MIMYEYEEPREPSEAFQTAFRDAAFANLHLTADVMAEPLAFIEAMKLSNLFGDLVRHNSKHDILLASGWDLVAYNQEGEELVVRLLKDIIANATPGAEAA